MRQYLRGLVSFREGENGIGLRLIRSGHILLDPGDSTREARTFAGQLHLGGSALATRAQEARTAGSPRTWLLTACSMTVNRSLKSAAKYAESK
ncbi:hypothetical protein ACIQMY_20115 [Streptomyces sp. NPDC091368]|uniref:hypothetical protein n=1 Tax=Streptomyces sp. NPDC091368 TaxID=3365993 RepID=UPI00382FE480